MKEYEMMVCPIRKTTDGFTMFCTETCAWFNASSEECAVAILAEYAKHTYHDGLDVYPKTDS